MAKADTSQLDILKLHLVFRFYKLLMIAPLQTTCFFGRGRGRIYLKVALELAKAADLGVIG